MGVKSTSGKKITSTTVSAPDKAVSFKVADNLFIVQQSVGLHTPAPPEPQPTNFIIVVDCSGSMSGDLPRVREQLKKRLPKLLKEGDTLSVIWFSGKNQFGTLLQAEPVATLTDLQTVNTAIDRWLKPVGMTGFCDPLHEVSKLVKSIQGQNDNPLVKSKNKNTNPFALVFMSDGADNQWPKEQILGCARTAGAFVSSATFVEYGYYADRPMLTTMAAEAGGALIHASDFDAYAPVVEKLVQKRAVAVGNVLTSTLGDPVDGLVWRAVEGGDVLTYLTHGGSERALSLPDDTVDIYYLSQKQVGAEITAKVNDGVTAAYVAMSLFATRMRPDIVLPLLSYTGDVAFGERFARLFGKQQYSEFMDAAKAAAFDMRLRGLKGLSPNVVPRDDAFSLMELLDLFCADKGNRLLLERPEFKYSRIGRKRVDADSVFSAEELEEITRLGQEQSEAVAKKDVAGVKAATEKLQKVLDGKPLPLQFVPQVNLGSYEGYEVSNLTFNEENPNVSVLVKKQGSVDLRMRKRTMVGEDNESVAAQAPDVVMTHIWRNYAIVKDGLVNVDTLPVKLSPLTLEKIFAAHRDGKLADDSFVVKEDGLTLVNLKAFPILNRQQALRPSARELFENEWALLKAQAAQKVFKAALKDAGADTKSDGFVEWYGAEATAWLKELGITEHGGFAPKMVTAPPTDAYMAREMSVKIKGFSSLPSVAEVRKQMAANKLNGPGKLMADSILAVDAYKAKHPSAYTNWLFESVATLDTARRKLISQKARLMFAVVVGQTWFHEFKSLDEGSMTLDLNGQKLECKVEMREVEVKI